MEFVPNPHAQQQQQQRQALSDGMANFAAAAAVAHWGHQQLQPVRAFGGSGLDLDLAASLGVPRHFAAVHAAPAAAAHSPPQQQLLLQAQHALTTSRSSSPVVLPSEGGVGASPLEEQLLGLLTLGGGGGSGGGGGGGDEASLWEALELQGGGAQRPGLWPGGPAASPSGGSARNVWQGRGVSFAGVPAAAAFGGAAGLALSSPTGYAAALARRQAR